MNDKHPEYEMTEAFYIKGRMDEKQAKHICLSLIRNAVLI